MTQIAAPLLGDLRQEVGQQVSAATPAAAGRVTRLPRLRVEPLIHLLAASAALAATWPAGVHPEPLAAAGLLLTWPALLAALGCWAERPLASTLSRLRPVVHAGAVVGLGCWVGSGLGIALLDGLVAPVAAVVAASAATVLMAGWLGERGVRLVVAGAPADVERALDELARDPQRCHVVATWLTREGEDVHGPVTEAEAEGPTALALAQGADALLVVPGPGLTPTTIRRLAWAAASHQLELYVGTGLIDVAPSRTTTVRAGGMGAVHVRPAAGRGCCRFLKDVAERVAAACALVLLAPALLVVGLLVRRDSPGPALFRQRRVGRDGREFTMLKFRTMCCDAEQAVDALADRNEADGVLFKLRSDPRVTPLGAVLRRYSVDELPQLWNIVCGHMSLVGPRPALPSEVEQYDHDPRRRLAVKPGLTGLWQVSGRSDLSWEESVRLDLSYVDNWSLPMDAAILGRTVRAVVGHRGAY
ncbi:sugar transferase [Nocardioides coralli]|uniref:sugar transferase n=1 Tax=Nocardioides coralli TaxID=2872154 RepID=UPI001CA3F61A|nr:sugar transferase [Nocardioides coralli]QZY29811.1 exopolysaccharide biosynthesis polyprenyl glycosylphosphotransferase [Nocardioides coralli]